MDAIVQFKLGSLTVRSTEITINIRLENELAVDLRNSKRRVMHQVSVCCHSVDQYFINTCSLRQRLIVSDCLC